MDIIHPTFKQRVSKEAEKMNKTRHVTIFETVA